MVYVRVMVYGGTEEIDGVCSKFGRCEVKNMSGVILVWDELKLSCDRFC